MSGFAADIFSQLTCRFHASKSASGAYAAFFKAPSLQPPTPKPPTSNSNNLTHKRYIEPNRQCFKFHISNLKPNPPFATETIRQFRTSCPSQKLTMFPHVQVRLWRVCCTPRRSKLLQPPTQKPILEFQKLFLK